MKETSEKRKGRRHLRDVGVHKDKLSLCLTKRLAIKTYGGVEVSLPALPIGPRRRWEDNIKLDHGVRM